MKAPIIALIIAGLATGAGAWWWRARDGAALSFTTAKVKRGEVAAAIGATGTIEPIEVVEKQLGEILPLLTRMIR